MSIKKQTTTTPSEVDFIFQSKPLTDLERKEISEYIRSKKLKNKTVKAKKKNG
jgi:hypothetical protein